MYTATPLTSSMLSETSYDSETQTLVIQFAKNGQRGDTWYYAKVPFHIFEGLIAAESAGKYFLANIKKKFDGRKVEYGAPFKQIAGQGKWVVFGENRPQEQVDLETGEIIAVPATTPPEKLAYPTQLPDDKGEKPF